MKTLSGIGALLLLTIWACGEGSRSTEESLWTNIDRWREKEAICENAEYQTGVSAPGIEAIVDYLNDNSPPKRTADRDYLPTSCQVKAGSPAACGGLASWAYAMIRQLGVNDNDLWMVQVYMSDGTPHTFVRYRGYAIEHYQPSWPRPYFYREYEARMAKEGYEFVGQFNIFN